MASKRNQKQTEIELDEDLDVEDLDDEEVDANSDDEDLEAEDDDQEVDSEEDSDEGESDVPAKAEKTGPLEYAIDGSMRKARESVRRAGRALPDGGTFLLTSTGENQTASVTFEAAGGVPGKFVVQYAGSSDLVEYADRKVFYKDLKTKWGAEA